MFQFDPAGVLATAAKDALADWSDRQQAAMLLTAELLAAAWDAGLERNDLRETHLFKGTDAERLAAADEFIANIPDDKLEAILKRHGLA